MKRIRNNKHFTVFIVMLLSLALFATNLTAFNSIVAASEIDDFLDFINEESEPDPYVPDQQPQSGYDDGEAQRQADEEERRRIEEAQRQAEEARLAAEEAQRQAEEAGTGSCVSFFGTDSVALGNRPIPARLPQNGAAGGPDADTDAHAGRTGETECPGRALFADRRLFSGSIGAGYNKRIPSPRSPS